MIGPGSNKNGEESGCKEEISVYQKAIAQLHSIGDPSGVIPSITIKLNEAKSKLASELPLFEQLVVATDAHTLAQTTLTKRKTQTALAQRFYQEAQ